MFGFGKSKDSDIRALRKEGRRIVAEAQSWARRGVKGLWPKA